MNSSAAIAAGAPKRRSFLSNFLNRLTYHRLKAGAQMRRYHHDKVHRDFDGMELPDKNAAWEEVTKTTSEIIKDFDGSLRPGHDSRMEVTDEFANP